MVLTWSSAMATGVRQIDLQHQELIEIINDLERVHGAGGQNQDLNEALPRLTAYVMFHFTTEESMMRDSDIASGHFAEHEAQHRIFAERVKSLRAHPDIPGELASFLDYLKSWLTEHIMKTDKELASLLQARS